MEGSVAYSTHLRLFRRNACSGMVIGYNVKGLFQDLQMPVAIMIIIFTGARIFADSRRLSRIPIMAVESRRILMACFSLSVSIRHSEHGFGILTGYPDPGGLFLELPSG